jgi:hypothetical protein
MKKPSIVLFVLSVVLLCSCSETDEQRQSRIKEGNLISRFPEDPIVRNSGEYKTVTIDSCEYISGWSGSGNVGGPIFTHKGNCKNPIHNKTK